ncbi:MAG: FAD-binding oxidoreductase [Bryobacteraceae bacterium]
MQSLSPASPEELAEALAQAASAGKTITLGGAFTKSAMGGPVSVSEVNLTTTCLNRVRQYEPRDLTISVETGMPYAELQRLLAANRQMIPLDTPFADQATVGGIVASGSSGPRRRLYGTSRDLVIGMTFATLEGKLIQTGGMVVKNVAGLDMGKLMIGSFGTLAALAVVNFKVLPAPAGSRTFIQSFGSAAEALQARDGVLRSVLQPAALDLLNPAGAKRIGQEGWTLLIQAVGNEAVLDRCGRELAGAEAVAGEAEEALWRAIREFTPAFLEEAAEGTVVRASCTLTQVVAAMESMGTPALARAGNGVVYGYFPNPQPAAAWMEKAAAAGWKSVMEFAPPAEKERLTLWPSPGNDFETMKRIKQMFDPKNLLNRGRLYGRI